MRLAPICCLVVLLLACAPGLRAQSCISVDPQTFYVEQYSAVGVSYYVTISGVSGDTSFSADLSSLPSQDLYDGYSFTPETLSGSGNSTLYFYFDDSSGNTPIGDYPITIQSSGACSGYVTVDLDIYP